MVSAASATLVLVAVVLIVGVARNFTEGYQRGAKQCTCPCAFGPAWCSVAVKQWRLGYVLVFCSKEIWHLLI